MTSIITNTGAMAALSVLRGLDANMEKTQNRISSGYRVGEAADNAAYWSIATTMRSDNQALSTVQDALGLAASKVDTAYAALDTTIDLLSTIKSKLTAASEQGLDKEKVNKEITELKNQLLSVATSASFSGENWLINNSTLNPVVKSMVGSFVRNADNTVMVQTITFDSAASTLIDKGDVGRGILTKDFSYGTGNNLTKFFLIPVTALAGGTSQSGTEIKLEASTTNDKIQLMISSVESMLKSVTDGATTLGATKTRIDTQATFVKSLSDSITRGIGRLVDADMNEESTKLKALQTQQQLGIQSLSIANSASQNIMQLFR